MTKLKKIVLSLCVAVTMLIALVVGFVGRGYPQTSNSCGSGTINSNDTIVSSSVEAKSTTYHFDAGEVKFQRGGKTINYSYTPSVNSGEDSAVTVAYEYCFGNAMNTATAVNLKSIDTTDVTVSYAYSATKLTNTNSIRSEDKYTLQHLANDGDKVYIYVLVTPTNTTIPTTFTTSIVWYYGEPGEISMVVDGETVKQGIVKGQSINEPVVEVPSGKLVEGWYYDSEYTQPVTFPLIDKVNTLYVKLELASNLLSDWLAYDSTEGCYYVKQGTSTLPTELIIPDKYNDGTNGEHNVTYIDNYVSVTGPAGDTRRYGVFYGQPIVSVVIPNTITRIGSFAFENCASLTSVTLPDSLTLISGYAFSRCISLTSITIPSSVVSIGANAFWQCTNLTSVKFENTSGWLAGNTAINSSDLADTSTAATYLVGTYMDKNWECTSIAYLPSDWLAYDSTKQCYYVKRGTSGLLTHLNIPSTYNDGTNGEHDVTYIADASSAAEGVFYNKSMVSLVIPNTITSIGAYAFSSCNLSSVTIPGSVQVIGDYAFYNCILLSSVTISEGVTSIGDYAFSFPTYSASNGFKSITIPSSVTSIGLVAFGPNHGALTSVTFKNTSGWSAGDTAISSTDLANVRIAALYLKEYYYTSAWTRSDY